MPNKHGFDELPNRGNVELRCIWCGWHPGRLSEARQAQHARKHRKDEEAARAASLAEREKAQIAIVV